MRPLESRSSVSDPWRSNSLTRNSNLFATAKCNRPTSLILKFTFRYRPIRPRPAILCCRRNRIAEMLLFSAATSRAVLPFWSWTFSIESSNPHLPKRFENSSLLRRRLNLENIQLRFRVLRLPCRETGAFAQRLGFVGQQFF